MPDITIFASLNGTNIPVDVDSMASVGDLREAIAEAARLQSNLKLVLHDRKLEDEELLADAGVCPQSTVTVELEERCSRWMEGTEHTVQGQEATLRYERTGNYVAFCEPSFSPLESRSVHFRQTKPHGSMNHAVGVIHETSKNATNTTPTDGVFFGWREDSMYAYRNHPKETGQCMPNVALDRSHPLNQEGSVIEIRLTNGVFQVFIRSSEKADDRTELCSYDLGKAQLREGGYRFAVYLYSDHELTIV
eukprot:Hpha_TRINITY_DN33798_c0_g1::TRINITY_DN33798_c0_g1_i1::g.25018::m.25018